ncbi:hypothetical protein BD289DRAFT_474172 [Coniella lustricola]|uniref:Uncharacterized protein n=1 Tax=Coniella lustricola TaxID=2025994 RepID=A0A2T3A8D6_9PEZI|nr:hypothetical protein BD289DRAFT_474172 [Coniella lustricola]
MAPKPKAIADGKTMAKQDEAVKDKGTKKKTANGKTTIEKTTIEKTTNEKTTKHKATKIEVPNDKTTKDESIKVEGTNEKAEKTNQAVVATTFPLPDMPSEIQTLIWTEVLSLPACHTFVLALQENNSKACFEYADPPNNGWHFRLGPKNPRHDTSSYLEWKKLFKLKHMGFHTTFRLEAGGVEPINLELPIRSSRSQGDRQVQAALIPATDLVIFDFEGINKCKPFWWHNLVRNEEFRPAFHSLGAKFWQITKVAIQYKGTQDELLRPSHGPATQEGAFECPCGQSSPMHCYYDKYCGCEIAAFLALFPNIKEFYFVVHPVRQQEKKYARAYRKLISHYNYTIKSSNQTRVIRSFTDTQYQYVEQASQFAIPFVRRQSPWLWNGDPGPHHCLDIVVDTYYDLREETGTFKHANHGGIPRLHSGILIALPRG